MEASLGSMTGDAPGRVELLRQLGDTYASMADTAPASRAKAIDRYTKIVTEYGGARSLRFPSQPPPAYAQLDEVMYALGYSYERAGDRKNAQLTYFGLIQRMPRSGYVANAYLGLGDTFFDEITSDDSKLNAAGAAYERVLATSQVLDELVAYAAYKLGHVRWRQGNAKAAQAAFERSVEIASSGGDGGRGVADAARRALAALQKGKECAP
jgi:hypothetical protein